MKTFKIINYIFLVLLFTSCEETKIDIDKYGELSGLVLDGDDYTPLAGVLVTTNPASTASITDANGKFVFTKVKEGEVLINARKNDYLSSSINVSVFDGDRTDLTFFLLKDENNVGWVTIYDPVPGNGAVDQHTSFTFQWNVDQQNPGKVLDYTVYIFESNSTTQQIVGENLLPQEVVVDGLKYETTYFWYVVAKFEGNRVANSPTWTFKTGVNNDI